MLPRELSVRQFLERVQVADDDEPRIGSSPSSGRRGRVHHPYAGRIACVKVAQRRRGEGAGTASNSRNSPRPSPAAGVRPSGLNVRPPWCLPGARSSRSPLGCGAGGRQQGALGLRRAIEVDRLARQQHRHVDPRLADRLRAELPGKGDAGLVARGPLLHERDDTRDDRDREECRDRREDRARREGLALGLTAARGRELPRWVGSARRHAARPSRELQRGLAPR